MGEKQTAANKTNPTNSTTPTNGVPSYDLNSLADAFDLKKRLYNAEAKAKALELAAQNRAKHGSFDPQAFDEFIKDQPLFSNLLLKAMLVFANKNAIMMKSYRKEINLQTAIDLEEKHLATHFDKIYVVSWERVISRLF